MNLNLSTTLTIGTLQKIGPQRFSNYDPKNLNCQDFLLDILRSNNILTSDASTFIKQDAVALFEQVPSLTHKIASFVTDLGARANRFIQGEGLRQYIPHQKKLAKQLKMRWVKNIIISPLKTKSIE